MVRITLSEFIEYCTQKHNSKYGYDRVILYNGMHSKIEILCRKCDVYFEQRAYHHKNGSGCPDCGGSKKLTFEQVVIKSRAVHGDEYGYIKSSYKGPREYMDIICFIHGIFEQRPYDHYRKPSRTKHGKTTRVRNPSGCPTCNDRTLTNEDFIRAAILTHGKEYGYDKLNYVNARTHVLIKCYTHGYFKQMPISHLYGKHGCPDCGGCRKLTQEEFIERAIAIHGDKYNYSYVIYKNGKTKVNIECKKHGIFSQRAQDHIYSKFPRGCPECGKKNKSEDLCRKYLEEYCSVYQEVKFPNVRPKFMEGLELDGYAPNYGNIAFEYNGRQHYERVEAWQTPEQFQRQQERDRRKIELCKKYNIDLIIIDGRKYSCYDPRKLKIYVLTELLKIVEDKNAVYQITDKDEEYNLYLDKMASKYDD